jgi:chemotaxis protein histidine kinase CheA
MKRIRLTLAATVIAMLGEAGLAHAQPAAPPAAAPPRSDERYTETTPRTQEEIDKERTAIWDSAEMVAAREWLVDHMARSARITPSQSQRYMEELKRLSPEQMKLWLMTFEEQQAERNRQNQSFEAARQMSVDRAMQANQASQQAAENVTRTRNQAAQTAQESMRNQQQAAQQRSQQLTSDRDAAARAILQPSSYIWLNTTPWGPYAGYPIGGGPAIDPAAFRGVLGIHNREPANTVSPGARRPETGRK